MLPKVTLLIPCYNSAEKLPYLLQDALRQTVPFYEIIIYDDGSSDDTTLIAEQFGCRVIGDTTNRGAGWARQQLLKAATTPYVHFHDSDDRMELNFLQVLLPYCQENLAVCCAMKEVLKSGDTVLRQYHSLNDKVDLIQYFIQNFVHMNAVIYPREAALRAGGFRSELRTNQDRVFHYSLAAENIRFIYIDQPLVTQIRHSESTLSKTKFSLIINNFLKGAEIAIELFPSKYHSLIGDYSLYYAEKAAYRSDYQLMHQAVNLARRCGVKDLCSSSRAVNLLSRFIGIRFTLIIRSKYAKFRKFTLEEVPDTKLI
jgi:glycosyltransferase involved in cell wall biosynthesis